MNAPTAPRKLRVRFSKTGKVRFTSHRDVARIWERALRRVGLPVAYSEGFSPRPRLSFGLALSTGHESHGEYLDVNLREDAPGGDVACELFALRVNPALPAGLEVQAVEPLPPGADSLQQAVTSCTWHFELSGLAGEDEGELGAAIDRTLASGEIVVTRERKGQEVTEDIRPCILALQVLPPGTGCGVVEAELATQPRSLRPAELVNALDPALHADRVVRIHQWTLVGGARQEVIPLPPAATLAPHAQARAS
jgi:radical SAM-linked protein